ncbi:hypothetical protein JTB14_012897 [Gonioctena quinquepunctata]|nr:hypothetical protein JTB14_012897 [Gonioctena quinquepunctata]
METKVYNIPKSSTPRSLKLISHMRRRGDEESFRLVMKSLPGTNSATENDGVPKKDSVSESDSIPVNVPWCSSDLKENTSKFEDISDSEMEDNCSKVADVPETISTPIVEKESNISMDYQANLKKRRTKYKKSY